MRYKNYCLLLLCSLTACASNQWDPSAVEEIFVTDIKVSGLKMFNYSLINTRAQSSGKADSNGRGNGRQGGGRGMGGKGGGHGAMDGGNSEIQSSFKPFFTDMLEAKLKTSGYCRQGYIELDSYLLRGQMQIRGECEEGATDEDRIKFVNKENT
ncbi:MAG: hypothetical protein OQK98_12715 [Gammaproteobacteria bacterium]|nr:hypothetical protein [Gammaproteobacteria bacterium]